MNIYSLLCVMLIDCISSDSYKENAVAAGMNGHIAKPIDVPKLLNTLAGILN